MNGDIIYYSSPGVGDNVMLTAVAHNYYDWYGEKMPIHTTYPELFLHNPYVEIKSIGRGYWDVPVSTPHRTCEYCRYTATRFVSEDISCDYLLPKNLIFSMCKNFVKPGSLLVTPELFLTPEERERGRLFVDEQIVLNYMGKEIYKTWDFDKASCLAEHLLSKGYKVLQTGLKEDRLLPGVVDLRGQLTLRELASVLSMSRLYVGPMGGGVHLARSVSCPGVVLFPGAENVNEIQYGYQLLKDPAGCTLCQQRKIDPFCACFEDANCTFNISFKQVVDAVDIELSHEKQDMKPGYMQVSEADISELLLTDASENEATCAIVKLQNAARKTQKTSRLFAGMEMNVHFLLENKDWDKNNKLCFARGFVYYVFSYSEYDSKRKLISTHEIPDNLCDFIENGCGCKSKEYWLLIPQNNTDIILNIPWKTTECSKGFSLHCMAVPLKAKTVSLCKNDDFTNVRFFANRTLLLCGCLCLKEIARRIVSRIKRCLFAVVGQN